MNGATSYVSSTDDMRGGAFAGAHSLGSRTSATANDDVGNPRIGWVLVLIIIAAVVLGLGYIAIYYGVQYGTPSWGAHAYPPPLIR